MSVVAIPKTWVTGDVLTTADLNILNSVIYGEFNGNIDDSNIKNGANINGSKLLAASIAASQLAGNAVTDAKLDYTSAKVLRVGPNFAGGTNGKRIAVGGKSFTYVAGLVTITITFSSDSEDGNPAFVAAPIVTGTTEVAGGVATHSWRIISRLASSVTLELRSSNGADASSGTFHWHAVGNV